MNKIRIFGMIISLLAGALAWYLYDWKLLLILLLSLYGNNMEQQNKN